MIGHSLGRVETCFGWERWDPGPKELGSGNKTHLESRCWLHRIMIHLV